MARKTVHVRKRLAAQADAVWTVARQFCGNWHPFLEWVREERSENGELIRAFKAKGEDTVYRECLSHFSDADREYRYIHLEGIKDVISYSAKLKVLADDEFCYCEWDAELEAPEPRASEIANGTRIVFEAGLEALTELANPMEDRIGSGPTLAVTRTAPLPGPLLLFLHGIGGNRRNWTRQLQAMAPHLQSAALDLRGYGDSELGPQQTRIDDYCDDILRVMAHFGQQKVVLCGMSLGSWIATSFAMRHPHCLAGLILSGGCTGMSEAPPEEREAFLAARQKPLNDGLTPRDFAEQVVRVIAGPSASADVIDELRGSMAAIPSATYRDALWCFTHPEERFDFSRISCPVLMMTGEFDRLASPREIGGVARRIQAAVQDKDVAFEVIPDAGHLCNIENPQAYNVHLTQFLRRLPA